MYTQMVERERVVKTLYMHAVSTNTNPLKCYGKHEERKHTGDCALDGGGMHMLFVAVILFDVLMRITRRF